MYLQCSMNQILGYITGYDVGKLVSTSLFSVASVSRYVLACSVVSESAD